MFIISIQKLIKNNVFFFKVFFILFASFFFLLLIFQGHPSHAPVLLKVNYSPLENLDSFMNQGKKNLSFIDRSVNNYFTGYKKYEQYHHAEFIYRKKFSDRIYYHLNLIKKKEYAKKKEDQRKFVFRTFFNHDKPVSTFGTNTTKQQEAEAAIFFKNLIKENTQYLLEEYVNEMFQAIVKRREDSLGLFSRETNHFILTAESYYPKLKNIDPRSYIPELAQIESDYTLLDGEVLKKKPLEGEELRIAIKYKKTLKSIYNLSSQSIYYSAPDYALWLHLLKLNLQKDPASDYESERPKIDLNPYSGNNSPQLNDFLFFYYVLLEARDQFKKNEDLFFSSDTKFHYNINKNKKFHSKILEKELIDFTKTFSPKYEIYSIQKNYFKYIVGLILFLSLFLATLITIIKNYPKLGK